MENASVTRKWNPSPPPTRTDRPTTARLCGGRAVVSQALAIDEELRDEKNAASTYHNLGALAAEGHDYTLAEQWYRKSLAIEKKLGNEDGVAKTYHQLGIIAREVVS
jgi:Tetratricopeptide repeat